MSSPPMDMAALESLRDTFPGPAARRMEVLRRLGDDPTLMSLVEVGRWLDTQPDLQADLVPVEVALLADHTLEGLLLPLRTLARLRGLAVNPVVCPPYQVESELLNPESQLALAKAGAVVMLLDAEKSLASPFATPGDEETDEFRHAVLSRLEALAQFARQHHVCAFVSDFVAMHGPLSSPYAHRADAGRWAWFQGANAWIVEECTKRSLELLPVAAAVASSGADQCLNLRRYLSADVLYAATGFNVVAQLLTRQLAANFLPRKKVLVVDLDNTLWSGVLGEDGPDGVAYRPEDYHGRVFYSVLQGLRALSDTGVLLAIASKNDETEALALIAREDFPLSPGDFAAHRINWQPKPENLVSLAEELQLGLDSFVFLDDSDAECVLMRQSLPQVTVVQVPATLSEYPCLLSRLEGFDRPRLTETDRGRKQEYQHERERRVLAQAAPDFDAFLQTLAIHVDLEPVSESHLDRVVQLFERTNQFNMSGVRYRREELLPLVNDPLRMVCAHYTDRFGRGGVVGALVLSPQDDAVTVENFVLSCRVLGRQVERAIVAAIAQRLATTGITALRFAWQESPRNEPAKNFLATLTEDPNVPVHVSRIQAPVRIEVAWRENEQ